MRLDQYVSSSSPLSRKEAKRAIMAGRIRVNGPPCKLARQQVQKHDEVLFDGAPLTLPGESYLMINKPAGTLSATTDSDQPTVLDLLPPELAAGLHVVGRLDKDTTGLLLLTTDGQWSHTVTSPRRECPKCYRVDLAEPLTEQSRQQLEQGVMLKGESARTRPAAVAELSGRQILLTIHEGRYHQVKRMLAAVGNHVTGLHRQSIGSIALDPDLPAGGYRHLTQAEIDAVAG